MKRTIQTLDELPSASITSRSGDEAPFRVILPNRDMLLG